MLQKLLGAVVGLVVAGMVTPGPSMAAVAYLYQGPLFTDFTGPPNIYDGTMSISGTLTFDAALDPNIEIFLTPRNSPGLQAFSFTDGVNTITSSNTTDYGIRIFTDKFGDISDWRVDLQKFDRDNPLLQDNVMIITDSTGVASEYASTGTEIPDYTNANNDWFTDQGIATTTAQRGTWSVSPALAVPLDIKPKSCPNLLNVKSKGKLLVAILGTADFDVTEVDVTTVTLEGVSPIRSNLKDVATPFEPFTGKGDALDCNKDAGDGLTDLTLKFDWQAVVGALGPVNHGDVVVVTVSGELLDGTSFEGEDVIVIKKKGKK